MRPQVQLLCAILLATACTDSPADPDDTGTTSTPTSGTGSNDTTSSGESTASTSGSDTSSGEGPRLLKSDLPRDLAPPNDPEEAAHLIAENHQLAVQLYASQDRSTNIALSPLSFQYAFALLQAGAAGETSAQLARVLTKSDNLAGLSRHYNALDLKLSARNLPADNQYGEVVLRFANAMFARQDFTPSKAYLDKLAIHFGAGLYLEDFAGDPEGSRQEINAWVAGQTNQRIKDLLPVGLIQSNTVFQLINALYFKAAWMVPFRPERTTKDDFFAGDGDAASKVDMMHGDWEENVSFAKLEGEEVVVELGVGSGDLVFGLVLAPRGNFDAFAAGLTPSFFANLPTKLAPAAVHLSLPKFKVESGSVSFFDFFANQLGLLPAFENGDYSNMVDPKSSSPGFAITSVMHQAFVAVDEVGVEAAAASSVGGEDSAPDAWQDVVVDRPFVFYIRDTPTQALLFVGSVTNPQG